MATCPNGHENPDTVGVCSVCGVRFPPVGTAEVDLPPPPPPVPGPVEAATPASRRRGQLLIAGVVVVAVVAAGIAVAAGSAEDDVRDPPPSPSTVLTAAPSPTSTPTPWPSVSPLLQVTVPDVVGDSLKEARRRLAGAVRDAGEGAELDIDVAYTYTDKAVGTVLSSGPAAGVEIESGSTVLLTVAKAPPTVPNVVGLQVARATRALEDIGFTVRTKQQVSSEVKGTVIAQAPVAGTRLVPGERAVVLTVAKPPQGWYIRVLGSGSALVTWGNIGGTSQQTVALPFSAKVGAGGSFNVISVVAQRNAGDSGSITCQIVHTGRVVKQSTSSGAYAVCSASKST
jgi:hypothetical protein